MKKSYLLVLLIILNSCSQDEEKAIEAVLTEEIERGAVLRTVEIRNAEFDINDPSSEFNILLEEQDIEDGELLESVVIALSFIDMSPENGDQSVNSFLFKELLPSDFMDGPLNLPQVEVIYTFQEFLDAAGILLENVQCKDQFRLDLDLNLTDGRVFNTSNSAGTVINNTGTFNSPFSYIINITEPVSMSSFKGVYSMETIQDGGNGVPLGIESGLVELVQGHSNNVRIFRPLNDGFRIEFSIVCDVATVTRYQKTLLPTCAPPTPLAPIPEIDPSDRVLIGPDNPPGLVDSLDDSVFELYLLEGFEGFSVKCSYSDIPSKFQFSKQ